jgi:4a-hydroxytetrahydrobiopterin dehydratase
MVGAQEGSGTAAEGESGQIGIPVCGGMMVLRTMDAGPESKGPLAMPPLAKDEIKARLKALEGWEYDDGELERKYKFDDFVQSMEFVNRVAGLADAADHHPDISIKYNRVKVTLSTHSEGGVTEKDFALIAQIDGVPAREAEDGRSGGTGEVSAEDGE